MLLTVTECEKARCVRGRLKESQLHYITSGTGIQGQECRSLGLDWIRPQHTSLTNLSLEILHLKSR